MSILTDRWFVLYWVVSPGQALLFGKRFVPSGNLNTEWFDHIVSSMPKSDSCDLLIHLAVYFSCLAPLALYDDPVSGYVENQIWTYCFRNR